MNIRKHFFTVRVTEHWHRLPMDTVVYPSLKILKRSSLDLVLGINSLWMSLPDQRIGADDLQRALLASTVLRICDSTFSQNDKRINSVQA